MRREVFKGIPDTDEKTVKAFVDQNKESALKVKPKVGTIFFSFSFFFFLLFPFKCCPLFPMCPPPPTYIRCSMVANTYAISTTTIIASSCHVNGHHEKDTKTSGHRMSWKVCAFHRQGCWYVDLLVSRGIVVSSAMPAL